MISQGAYEIPKAKGLPPGKYRVSITAVKPGTAPVLAEGAMPGDEESQPPPQELIPPEWNRRSTQIVEVSETGPVELVHEIVTKKR
jgi:hypothetical protein